MTPTDIDQLAKTIWDYHQMHQELRKTDCIFVLGSHDLRVPDYATGLYLQGYAPLLIFSGGYGNWTRGVFKKTEAETFADIALARGVPAKSILVETKASNTGENVMFTKELLAERGIDPHTFILVQKPYMERRTYATFKKVWPEKDCIVTSPPISYEDYPNEDISRERMIATMVGDLQRIKEYPAKGFQIPQEIPAEVWNAYEALVKAGYTGHLST